MHYDNEGLNTWTLKSVLIFCSSGRVHCQSITEFNVAFGIITLLLKKECSVSKYT